jgi:hypothetical protein
MAHPFTQIKPIEGYPFATRGTIRKPSEITISINFNASVDGRAVTTEHAGNGDDRTGLKTLRTLRSPR